MRRIFESDKIFLLSYFFSIISIGTLFLSLPSSWSGAGGLHFIDALFTAVSAVCVTGLITVDTSLYSNLGRAVILLLIQAGGLGIISFATLYLTSSERKISLGQHRIIRSYFIEAMDSETFSIIRKIVVITLTIEGLGTLLLYTAFRHTVQQEAFFYALFHAVSAFCNAGFSLFPDNLSGYTRSGIVNWTIMPLIVLGGLGFVVLQDLASRLRNRSKKRPLLLHTKIVLTMTVGLILFAFLFYLIFESHGALSDLTGSKKILAALFQAITTRTAGFNTVSQQALSAPSRILTLLLMFLGGASGSIAGGIKVTTFFIVLMMAVSGTDDKEGLIVFKRRIPTETVFRATMFVMKALLILFSSILLLSISEMLLKQEPTRDFFALVFECFSAFGTVGLSLGLTPGLSLAGKLVIIVTMFLGRVGMLALAIPQRRQYPVHLLDYPQGEVMIG